MRVSYASMASLQGIQNGGICCADGGEHSSLGNTCSVDRAQSGANIHDALRSEDQFATRGCRNTRERLRVLNAALTQDGRPSSSSTTFGLRFVQNLVFSQTPPFATGNWTNDIGNLVDYRYQNRALRAAEDGGKGSSTLGDVPNSHPRAGISMLSVGCGVWYIFLLSWIAVIQAYQEATTKQPIAEAGPTANQSLALLPDQATGYDCCASGLFWRRSLLTSELFRSHQNILTSNNHNSLVQTRQQTFLGSKLITTRTPCSDLYLP